MRSIKKLFECPCLKGKIRGTVVRNGSVKENRTTWYVYRVFGDYLTKITIRIARWYVWGYRVQVLEDNVEIGSYELMKGDK